MRNAAFGTLTLLALVVSGAHSQELTPPEIPWRIASWNADSFGTQRAVISGLAGSHTMRVAIPWRRDDPNPDRKRIVVTDPAGKRIPNVLPLTIRADTGVLLFDPSSGSGTYYVYYLPYIGSVRSNYPRITYPPQDSTADPAWIAAARAARPDTLPRAWATGFEAVDSLSLRWPMQVPATPSEVDSARLRAKGSAFEVYVESRSHPIKMQDAIPWTWFLWGGARKGIGPAQRDEYYAFQLGIWALSAIDSVRATFGDLVAPGGARIPAKQFDCITTDGVDWVGRPFHRTVTVGAGRVAPLWCGVLIPPGAVPGIYLDTVTVTAAGHLVVRVPWTLQVTADVATNHGDDDPSRLSRLRWLNSQLAADGPPIPPYTRVRAVRGGFAILGRTIQLGALGLPRQITSSFTPNLTLAAKSHPLLGNAFAFEVEGVDGKVGKWVSGPVRTVRATPSRAVFTAQGRQGALDVLVRGTLEFDGNLEYQVALVARRDTAVRDVRLVVEQRHADYFMGMNRPGGRWLEPYRWTWDVATKNQDAFWAGNLDGGLQVTFKDEKYARPLNTNFYLQSPLKLPRSWGNDGKGSCRFTPSQGDAAISSATCGSGARTLIAHDTLWFNFRVLITPFHPIDTKTHFSTRYMHAYKPVDTARAVGANLVNVHHATAINPFINYPFLRPAAMKAYADSLHAADMRFKIYYTVRELTNHAPEIWALRSLGTEVLAAGPAGGHSWLQENMVDNYLPGWYVPALRDVAMVTSGISRWHNFYVEGMRWLTQHAGVDGIYLDDVAFDRTTMQRIRRILTEHGTPGERIDLHSATQYNKNDGFASSANLYLEHFPYIDRLWFGEYFNYDSPPDYWLIEMSGIPFGLMGEMLEGGGNPWRGMLFGMTNRLPWTGGDPRELWKAWDDFGLNDATMHGWWTGTPVHTGTRDVLATTYTRRGRALVAIASWAKDTVSVKLDVDWRGLGLDPARVRIYAPAIPNFQPARSFAVGERIPVVPGKGWLLRFDAFDAPARLR